MSETDIDRAHATMEAAPEDDAARLRFHERVADTELFLLLARDAEGDDVEPEMVETDEGRFVLVFDLPERLARFADGAAPYAALSGRMLCRMLQGQGIGLALNLDVAPSATLLPAGAVDWLVETLGQGPEEAEARIAAMAPPVGLPERIVEALDRKLAGAAGLARAAHLVSVTYENGTRGHLLAVVGAMEGAERALAGAVSEALTFSGLDAGVLDVAFFPEGHPMVDRLERQGLRFDLPDPPRPQTPGAAPGMDPDRPPKLR